MNDAIITCRSGSSDDKVIKEYKDKKGYYRDAYPEGLVWLDGGANIGMFTKHLLITSDPKTVI